MITLPVNIAKSPWMDLPRDVWSDTISFLNGVEAWNASMVCKEWQAVFTEECPAVLAPQWHRAEVNLYELHKCVTMINEIVLSNPRLIGIMEVVGGYEKFGSLSSYMHHGDADRKCYKRLFHEIAKCAQRFSSMKLDMEWAKHQNLGELFTTGNYDMLTKLDFCELVSYETLQPVFENVPNLTALSLDINFLRTRNVEELSHLKLNTLEIRAQTIQDFANLNNLSALTSLGFNTHGPMTQEFASLDACPKLKKLKIQINYGSNEWLEDLASCKALPAQICDLEVRSLKFHEVAYLADTILVRVTNLTRLTLQGCELVGERCSQALLSLPCLTDLSLVRCKGRIDLVTIAKCEKLSVLTLPWETDWEDNCFEFRELVQLNACSALTDLTLHRSFPSVFRKKIDIDVVLAVLSKLPRLRILEVPEDWHEPISKGLPRLTVYKKGMRLKAS